MFSDKQHKKLLGGAPCMCDSEGQHSKMGIRTGPSCCYGDLTMSVGMGSLRVFLDLDLATSQGRLGDHGSSGKALGEASFHWQILTQEHPLVPSWPVRFSKGSWPPFKCVYLRGRAQEFAIRALKPE
eukprot:1157360-Pelagomonas_calceolata.AAC.2